MREAVSDPANTVLTVGGTLVVGGAVEAARTRFPAGEYAPPPFEGHLVSLHRTGTRCRVWRVDGRTLEGVARTGVVGVVPAGKPFTFAVGEAYEALSVLLREGFMEQIAERAGYDAGRLEVLDRFCAPDPELERILLSFALEMEGGSPGGELYAEALATQLAVHVLRGHSSLGRRAKREVLREPPGDLPKRRLEAALDFIGDNLAGELSIEEISRQAGLSPYHFARLFKEATGLPPHRYVIHQRVEKAKGLLARGVAVGEVARLVGFSDQSHLARHFRRSTGLTPTDFR